jgi:hypothetical protein
MIKFFRKIRHRLLSQNKISRYFLYAIGEIILVVIGILIALQINTWNQDRINNKEEERILKAISAELKLSKFLFTMGADVQDDVMSSAKSLLGRMQNREVDREAIEKELSALTGRWLSGTPTSIYDALIGSGELKIISSEELRNELASLKSDQEFLRLFEEIQVRFVDEKLNPFLNKYINRGAVRSHATEISGIEVLPIQSSYKPLMESNEFANILVELMEHTFRLVRNYDRLVAGLDRIEGLINDKIKN